tara:strand:+ start:307 stop:450 length:144 start_codon:yes stop_codon:yes gene_type:complete
LKKDAHLDKLITTRGDLKKTLIFQNSGISLEAAEKADYSPFFLGGNQ